ncbi:MAG: cell division protein CrgA [Acidimicrobiia bacterium]|nr:cell division protein CrgA [Acidimicrobiia bacterium]
MADQGGKRSGARSASSRRKEPGTTGRVTPKGTPPKGTPAKGTPATGAPAKGGAPGKETAGQTGPGRTAPASGRYTPPVVRERTVSPPWVPALMFGLIGIGVLVIIVNYLGVLPGGSDNRYLLGGLAAITAGFVTATQYR